MRSLGKNVVAYKLQSLVLGGVIGALPMVENTHSYFVMEEVKETSLLPLTRPVAKRKKS